MKSFNWSSISATGDGGGFERLEAGPYVARITDFIDMPSREYVEVVYDIAEGPKAGFYSDDWGRSHPYAHHFFLSYKDSALGMLKGRLEAIAASNAGFDPFAAWDAAQASMFVGRLVGINLQEEEYERNDGEIATRLNVCSVVPAGDVREGKVKTRPKKALGKAAKPAAKAVDVYKGEIPFD